MSFNYNGEGVRPWSGGNMNVPAGRYRLRISETTEKESKNGDPMVVVDFIIKGGDYDGRGVRFHNVTFFGRDAEGKARPGSGIAIHFLKCIGQPWEGKFKVDHMKWRGAEVIAEVTEEEYNGKVNNKVKEVFSIDGAAAVEHEKSKEQKEEEVPF